MMRLLAASVTTALVSFSLQVAFAEAHATGPFLRKRHSDRTFGSQFSSRGVSGHLEKRYDNARFTLYDAGMGACGKHNSNNDFIVALNAAQYGGGEHCFETITINCGGKSTQAQVVDKCPGCPFGGLDFSRGLFDFFAPESAGVLSGSWTFGSGDPPKPKPQPTETPEPKPEPSTTTSHKPPTTTTTSHSSTTSTSTSGRTSQTASSTTEATPSATETGTAIPTDTLAQLYMVMESLSELAFIAGST